MPGRCAEAAARIRAAAPGAEVRFETADLSSQAEVRALAARLRDREARLDVLVNNAGCFTFRRTESVDGIELQLAVNHLAPFLLTHGLLPLLEAAPRARVVFVSSGSHVHGRIRWRDPGRRRFYNGLAAYGQSKLAVLMIGRGAGPPARARFEPSTRSRSIPGSCARTSEARTAARIVRWVWGLRAGRGIDRRRAAESIAWLAAEPSIAGWTGRYWKERQAVPSSRRSTDPSACRRLWDLSARLCGLAVASGLPAPQVVQVEVPQHVRQDDRLDVRVDVMA